MRHVSELTIQPPLESDAQTASSASLTEQHIALLWERMTMIYGHKWTSSYGEKDDGTWLKGLSDVTAEQIGVGLEKCRTSDDEWPPTLPMFRERCVAKPMVIPYHQPFRPALPRPSKSAEEIERGHKILQQMSEKSRRAAKKFEFRKPEKPKPYNDTEFEAHRQSERSKREV